MTKKDVNVMKALNIIEHLVMEGITDENIIMDILALSMDE